MNNVVKKFLNKNIKITDEMRILFVPIFGMMQPKILWICFFLFCDNISHNNQFFLTYIIHNWHWKQCNRRKKKQIIYWKFHFNRNIFIIGFYTLCVHMFTVIWNNEIHMPASIVGSPSWLMLLLLKWQGKWAQIKLPSKRITIA